MLGAIIGDIVGSRFEFRNHKSKEFELFAPDCSYTDDSVMTAAIAKAILVSKTDFTDLSDNAIKEMKNLGNSHLDSGYGGHFLQWLIVDQKPYGSYGNGAAMRISPIAYVANSIEDIKMYSKAVTKVSHDHPEGLKGAEVTATAIYFALQGKTKEEIKTYTEKYYPISFTCDEIRPDYSFDVSCQGSVPQALECFYEGKDFEDVIRLAISIGGDSDTIAAIAGSIAEAYFGIPNNLRIKAFSYLDTELAQIVNEFEEKYPSKSI